MLAFWRYFFADQFFRSVISLLILSAWCSLPGHGQTPTGSSTGTILREQWDGVPGYEVEDVPVDLPPSSTSLLTRFEASSNIGDNYGARIRGYLYPSQTGKYTFWIAGDNQCVLRLSTDATPAHKLDIARVSLWNDSPGQWSQFSEQRSVQIDLIAGQRYYIEAVHKEQEQSDHLAVAWLLPDGTFEGPISGVHLSPFIPADEAVSDSLLARGIIAHLPLDDSTGIRATDISGYQHHGQLNNGGTWRALAGVNRRGALELNAGASLSLTLSESPTTFTLSWWVKPLYRYNWNMLIGNHWGGFVFHTTMDGGVYVGTDMNQRIFSEQELVQLNIWQHFVFTFDRGTGALFRNGKLVGRKGGMAPPDNWDNFIISGSIDNSIVPGALYHDFRLYNRAISGQEVVALYKNQLAGTVALPPPICIPIQVAIVAEKTSLQVGDTLLLRAQSQVTGHALSFDGVDDYLDVAAGGGVSSAPALAQVTNTFTVEAWVWPTATHQIDDQRDGGTDGVYGQRYAIYPFHTSGSWGGDHAGMGISVGTNGVSIYEHNGNYMPALLVWKGSLQGWTHIAVVYQDRVPSLYINGHFVQQGLRSLKSFVHPSLNCGGGQLGYFSGSIDELRVWQTARSGADILANYQRVLSDSTFALAGCWHFDEGAGIATYEATAGSPTLEGLLTRGRIWNGQCWSSECFTPPPTLTGPQWVRSTAPLTAAALTWSPAAGLSSPSGAVVVARPAQTTTYTVTATGPGGCSYGQAQVTVTVDGSPAAGADQMHVASSFSPATGRGYVLTSKASVRAYEVDGDGVARTGAYQHADGTRFELQARQVLVSHVQAPHSLTLLP